MTKGRYILKKTPNLNTTNQLILNVQHREIEVPLKYLHLHLFLFLFLLVKPCSEGEWCQIPVPVRGWSNDIWFLSQSLGHCTLSGRHPIIISTLARHWYRKKPDLMYLYRQNVFPCSLANRLAGLTPHDLPAPQGAAATATQDLRTTCSR